MQTNDIISNDDAASEETPSCGRNLITLAVMILCVPLYLPLNALRWLIEKLLRLLQIIFLCVSYLFAITSKLTLTIIQKIMGQSNDNPCTVNNWSDLFKGLPLYLISLPFQVINSVLNLCLLISNLCLMTLDCMESCVKKVPGVKEQNKVDLEPLKTPLDKAMKILDWPRACCEFLSNKTDHTAKYKKIL